MKDANGRDQVAIIKLKNRIEGHKATYYEDYQVIRDLYEERLNAELIENFIREKQKTTYCKIRQGWDNYDFKYPGWGKR